MPPLAELQESVRNALVLGAPFECDSMLVGGDVPSKRLAIHQRHYGASLVRALLERFPATVWLVGSPFVTDAAYAFIRSRPPSGPCIAEYGEEFPEFLATRPGAAHMSYLRQFAELEWQLGWLALAVEVPALSRHDLFSAAGIRVGAAKISLQPACTYLQADWAIDELISLYLSGRSPERFRLDRGDMWLELRGLRGELWMNRLSHAEFVFRAALARGESLIDAAVSVVDIEARFDPGLALLRLVNEGLVVAIDGMEGAK